MYKRFVRNPMIVAMMLLLLSFGNLFILPTQAADVTLVINGQTMDASKVQIVSGRTLVPLRMISENLGAQVSWDGTTRTVEVRGTDLHLKFTIDHSTYLANGATKTLDVSPMIVEGSTLVPLRVIGEHLGTVEWHNESRTISVRSGNVLNPSTLPSHNESGTISSTDAAVAAQEIINEVFYSYLTSGTTKATFTVSNAKMSDVVSSLRVTFPTSQFLEVTPIFTMQGNKLTIDLAGGNEMIRQNFQSAYSTLEGVAAQIKKEHGDVVARRTAATEYLCQHWQYQHGAGENDLSQYSLHAAVITGKSVCAGIESYACLLFNKLDIPAYRVNYYQSEVPLIGHTVTRYLENGQWHYVNFTMLDDRYDRGLGADFLGNYWRKYDNIGVYRLYGDLPTPQLIDNYLTRFRAA